MKMKAMMREMKMIKMMTKRMRTKMVPKNLENIKTMKTRIVIKRNRIPILPRTKKMRMKMEKMIKRKI